MSKLKALFQETNKKLQEAGTLNDSLNESANSRTLEYEQLKKDHEIQSRLLDEQKQHILRYHHELEDSQEQLTSLQQEADETRSQFEQYKQRAETLLKNREVQNPDRSSDLFDMQRVNERLQRDYQ